MAKKVIDISRIRGCLLGALAGDCLGRKFEGCIFNLTDKNDNEKYRQDVLNYVEECFSIFGPKEKLKYTDDTAMARVVAATLVDQNYFDEKAMAKGFVETYFSDKCNRGYGGSISQVFKKLRDSDFDDVFLPAEFQFNATGSYGNGGAMRVAPVALYFSNDLEVALHVAKEQCRITHSNPHAIMGAVLIAFAVYQACNAEQSLSQSEWITNLLKFIQQKSADIYPNTNTTKNPYYEKLSLFSNLIKNDSPRAEVSTLLGNGIAALDSVPAALFSFIKCIEPVDEISMSNPLQRTIAYAISLSGDTDTIATMAGAIAGALYGDVNIPDALYNAMEGSEFYSKIALKMHRHLHG
ncbi:Poly(ADP-ribose) glycohydrolase ARH3 [Trichinella pseudospiralis]|uniref:ADP-ribosylhydrolase ARH3 n=1 Tax=Trichinella pseudospiralis TaxID=6337 RepID=A0A0V0XUI0_TRIPS|nr:Poly(ADP-ribose) glycohydrolase ARH3 [Trichinella pseudospiralis]